MIGLLFKNSNIFFKNMRYYKILYYYYILLLLFKTFGLINIFFGI